MSLENFLLGYSLLKLLLKIKGWGLYWSCSEMCTDLVPTMFLMSLLSLIQQIMYQICTYYVLGTKANTRDTVSADIVLMVWLGRQTIRIHIMGSTIQEKNRV